MTGRRTTGEGGRLTRIDRQKAEALFEHGVLTFAFAEAESVKPSQIKARATSVGLSWR